MNPVRFLLLVTIACTLASLGYCIAGIVDPAFLLPETTLPNDGTFLLTLYLLGRTLPLAILVILAAVRKNVPALITLALLAGCIQLFDGFLGIYQHDFIKTAGPFSLALLEFAAILRVKRRQAS